LANSLLGLIVFSVEKKFVRFIREEKLQDLAKKGWPSWTFELASSETLGDLVYHLRNAVAHGRLLFSSDSRNPADVRIRAEDARPKAKQTGAPPRCHTDAREPQAALALPSIRIRGCCGTIG
jgi:hypothetical protein